MALKTQIDVGADVAKIRESLAAFDKYSQAVRKSPSQWDRYGAQVKATQKVTDQITKSLYAHGVVVDRVAFANKRFADAGRIAGTIFSNLAKDAKSVAERLGRAAASLLSVATITGAVGGILGLAGGLFGAVELSRAVASKRKTALGLGISYGQLSAFGVNFGRYGDVEAQLGAVSGGLYDHTSPAYLSLLSTGVLGGKSKRKGGVYSRARRDDAADKLLDLYQNLPQLFANTPDEAIGSKAQAFGITEIMSVKELVAYLHDSPEGQKRQARRALTDAAAMTLSKKSQIAWSNFSITLDRSSSTIKTIIADRLTPLAEPLEHLSKSAVGIVDAFSKTKLADDAITRLDQALGWMSDKIASREFQYGAQHFLDGMEKMIPVVKNILAVIGHVAGRFGQIISGNVRKKDLYLHFEEDDIPESHPPMVGGGGGVDRSGRPSIRYGYRTGHKLSTTPGVDRIYPGLVPMTENGVSDGGAVPGEHGLTSDYSGLRLYSPEAVAGGPAEAGLIALARHEQATENVTVFRALRDHWHIFENPSSFHNRGLAFDVLLAGKDYEGARQRVRQYLTGLGLSEGDMGGASGDFAIEPRTWNHLHVQFNSEDAAEKYLKLVTPVKAHDVIKKLASSNAKLDPGAQIDLMTHGGVTKNLHGAEIRRRSQRENAMMRRFYHGHQKTSLEEAEIHSHRQNMLMRHFHHGEQSKKTYITSYLDHFIGAKDPKAIIVHNDTGHGATIDHTRMAYG